MKIFFKKRGSTIKLIFAVIFSVVSIFMQIGVMGCIFSLVSSKDSTEFSTNLSALISLFIVAIIFTIPAIFLFISAVKKPKQTSKLQPTTPLKSLPQKQTQAYSAQIAESEIIQRARTQAQQILEQAKNQANQIIDQTKIQNQQTVSQTNEKSRQVTQKAVKQAQQILGEASSVLNNAKAEAKDVDDDYSNNDTPVWVSVDEVNSIMSESNCDNTSFTDIEELDRQSNGGLTK